MRSSFPIKPLGEIIRLEYGKPLPRADRTEEQSIPAYGANGVLCWSKQAYREMPSIIVGRKGSAGAINLTDGPFWPTDVTYFVEHVQSETDLRYLFYLLKFLELPKLAKGVKPGINRNDVYALSVPVPALPDQQRIAAILDETFEGIAKATANVELNLANTQELFFSELARAFKLFSDDDLVVISDACEEIVDCLNRTAPKVDRETPYMMIRTTNVRDGKVDLNNVKYVEEETYQKWTRRQVPRAGDVLLTREAPLGEVGMLEGNEQVFLGQRIVSYRTDKSKLLPEFLLYCLRSDLLQRQIKGYGSGATVKHMRVPESKSLNVPLPDLQAQALLVQKLDEAREKCDFLTGSYRQKLAQLEELKSSILSKAFSGQLTLKNELAA